MDATFVTLSDGRRLSYSDVGPADGRAVMYFHGAPSSRLDLRIGGIDEQLARRGIRVVSPDRPGYGGSTPQPARGMDNWARDVAELADHLDVEDFVVIGMSSGGPYSVAVAALLEDRIVGCGVVAGVTDMGWAQAWEGYDESEAALMRTTSEIDAIEWCEQHYGRDGSGLFAGGTTQWSEADLALFADDEVANGFVATTMEALRQGVGGFAQDVWLQGRPWSFDPAAIVGRCHVLHGETDSLVPVRHAHHTASVIPGAQLITLPGHGHLSVIAEIPSLVDRLVAST
jgi:pimeloyl-ACP methyl ester carboxylesterase